MKTGFLWTSGLGYVLAQLSSFAVTSGIALQVCMGRKKEINI
jgi:hypothetical protein